MSYGSCVVVVKQRAEDLIAMKFTAHEYSLVFVTSRSSRVVGRPGARRESVYRAFNREKSHCTRPLVPRVPRVMSGDRYLVLISVDIPRSNADFRSVFRVVTRHRRIVAYLARGRSVLLRTSFCASLLHSERAAPNLIEREKWLYASRCVSY